MISYILLRLKGSTITMLLLIVIITIALAPSSLLTSRSLFVSSFHTAPTIQRTRRTSINTTASRIIRPSSNFSLTRLQLSSTTSSTTATTSAATLSYLNSLQSITSNPNLFPATSDTIEALLSQQQQTPPFGSSGSNENGGGEISPRDFLMNLSREVMLASSKEEGSVASSSPTVAAAVSLPNNSNLISEGMTAEEATAARTKRFQEQNNVDINNNKSMSTTAAMAAAVTEGMTAEQAQTARMARLQQPTPVAVNNGESKSNRGSVSGLRQAASSTRMKVKEPSSYAPTIQEDNESSSSPTTDSSDIQNDELLSSSTTTATKFLGVTYTNPQTPTIATTTGIASGLASYNLIDNYAYQFNTLHNKFILNQMDRNDELVEKWDGVVNTYGMPVQDWIERHPELVAKLNEFNEELGMLNHEVVEKWDELIGSYFVPMEDGGDAAGVGGDAAPVEFTGVDSSAAEVAAAAVPEPALTAAASPSTTSDSVTMDQGSAINTPVEASSDTVAPAPIEQQLSDASVDAAVGSPETATVPPAAPLEAAAPAAESATAAPSLDDLPVGSSETATVPPTTPLEAATAESTTATAVAPSLDDLPAIDESASTTTTTASSFESGSTNVLPEATATTAAEPVETTQYSEAATASTPSLDVGAVEEVATNNAPESSFDGAISNLDLASDSTAAASSAAVEPVQYSDVAAGVGTITAPSSNEATVEVATPVDATQYVEAASPIDSTPVVPSVNDVKVEEIVNNAPVTSYESGSSDLLAEATPTPVEHAHSAVDSVEEVVGNVHPVQEFADSNAPVASFDGAISNLDLVSDSTAAASAAAVEPAQYSDVSAGADTITAAPSLNEATAVDVAAPVDATQYVEAASSIDSTSVVPSVNDVKVEEVIGNTPVTSYESGNTDLLAEATPTPVEHAHSAVDSVEEVGNVPVSSYESGDTGLLADATTSAPVDAAQYSETTPVSSMNGAIMNQDVGNAPTFEDLLADAKTASPVDAAQYSETTTVPSMNGATMNEGFGSSSPPTFEDLLAAAKTSAPADPAQYSESTTVPSMNGATVNQDVGSSTATTLDSGNTDLLADATASAPAAPTQLSDVSGADTANVAPSLNDVNTIDQNVFNAPAPDLFAESTHQQRWFTAPTDRYTPTEYATTVDQSGPSSGGFSFDGGSNGGSSLTDSYSSWQPQGNGNANPLRDLAASLPPPEDRMRGTGGDYYPASVTSQWFPTQGDGFHPVADAAVTGMDGLADSVLSSDYSIPPISNGEVEASISSIPTDALDSLTTSSIDASIKELLSSSKANLFGTVSHSFGDIQGKANLPANVPVDHMPFDNVLQNAGETFQSFHPPAAVSSAIQHASDASLADIGNSIMGAVKFMAGILLTVVDANIDLAAPGSSSASVLEGVRSSVNSMLDNASYTVANVINDVGNLTLKDIVHNLMILIVATTDMIMKVMNAVVYLLSGKDAGNWALQATSTVNEATSQLLAQADDVTHERIGDLASSIGDYSYQVGNELVALLGSLNGVEGTHFDGTLDMVTTAMQTGFTMQ